MKSSFTTGFLTALVGIALIQDYVGQEQFISWITNHWLSVDWYIWLIPLTYLSIEHYLNERHNQLMMELLKQGKPFPYSLSFPSNPEEGQIFADVKGNEYIFKNGIWKTTKNIKDELNKFNLDDKD